MSVKTISIHIILLLIGTFLWAQSAKKEEEKRKTDDFGYGEQQPVNKADYLNFAIDATDSNPEQALDWISSFFSASNENDPVSDQQAYFQLGKIYLKLERYGSAADAFEQAEGYYDLIPRGEVKAKSSKRKGRIRKNATLPAVDRMLLAEQLGVAHMKAGDAEQGKRWLNNFLALAETRKDVQAQIRALNLLGDFWTEQQDLLQAESFYQRAVDLSAPLPTRNSYVNSLDNLSRNNRFNQQPQQARQNIGLAVEAAEEVGDDELLDQSYQGLTDYYVEENQLDSAIYAANKSLESKRKKGDREGEARQSNKLSEILIESDSTNTAIDILNKSLNIAQELGEIDVEAETHELLATGYEKQGNVDQALFHYRQARVLQDTLAVIREKTFKRKLSQSDQIARKDRQIAALLKEQELRETQIEIMTEKQDVQRRILWILGLVLGLVSVSAFLVVRSNRARRKANQLLALKSLRSQMNPHFIFNSLNSINGFIATHDDRAANKYLSDFSRLMRTVLEHSQQDFVLLGTELEVLKLYMKLEHFRFGDKFDYELEVDPELNQEQIVIPPMLVQPYIENAIWHGLRYKKEKGKLTVSIAEVGQKILIQIEDNGIGRKKSAELKTRNQKTHQSTGLKNTDQRVAIINDVYKAYLSVEIEDLEPNQEDTGTRVSITMPTKIHQA
ncbi:MAG: histidine kinase [Bacteroidota bacterium]